MCIEIWKKYKFIMHYYGSKYVRIPGLCTRIRFGGRVMQCYTWWLSKWDRVILMRFSIYFMILKTLIFISSLPTLSQVYSLQTYSLLHVDRLAYKKSKVARYLLRKNVQHNNNSYKNSKWICFFLFTGKIITFGVTNYHWVTKVTRFW